MKVKLPEFKNAEVMVVGDVMLDRYWYGPISRISSEAPVPVVKMNTVEERPGGAANVAMNIASLGVRSHLVGLIGIDDAARTIIKLLTNLNVNCDFISVPNHSTIIKLRVLSRNQQLIRIDFEDGFYGIDPTPMYKRINKSLDSIRVLVLSDYAKGTLTSVQQIIKLARSADIPVLVDPKGTDFARYRGATLLTPNLLEFEAVVGKCKSKEELIERGMKVIFDFELSALLVTRSEQGMILLQSSKEPLYMPTQAQEVYEVTGAGDTVIGVLAATLAAGSSMEEACYFANVAAGIVVGKLGKSTVSLIELKDAVRGQVDSSFGIINEEELKIVVQAARKRGEKMVMTNGVFDILHAGHISYLENARKLGDRLIVAVNSDASTKRLKGNTRPVNTLKNRMIVLEALKAVDWVVPFEEDTPQRLVANILPDLLVKGGDYKSEQIAGGKDVLANGGEVILLNLDNGYSTTNIIKKIKQDT